MPTPAYNRPDYEPDPAAPSKRPQPEPAIGYFEGIPHEPITPRRGLLGWLDRLDIRGQRDPANNACRYCGKPTPGYSWCSVEHSDLWDDENPW